MTKIDTTCEHTKIRLIAAALGHQQCTRTAASLIPLLGTDHVIAIGTVAEVARLLETAPPQAAPTAQEVTQQAAPACDVPPAGWYCTRATGHEGPCAAWPIAETGEENEEKHARPDDQGSATDEGYDASAAGAGRGAGANQYHEHREAESGVDGRDGDKDGGSAGVSDRGEVRKAVTHVTQQAAKAETAEQAEGEQANVLPPFAAPASLLNADELAALYRFNECALDGEGYDAPKEMMQRLAEIGVVRRKSGAYFEHTEYGLAVLDGTHQMDIGALVNSFLGWPLPDSLHDDLGRIEKPIGTHLMNADEARAMFEFVLASRFRVQGGNTTDKGSDLAPTTSTVSAPEEDSDESDDACRFCEGQGEVQGYGSALDIDPPIRKCSECDGSGKAGYWRTTSGKGEAA